MNYPYIRAYVWWCGDHICDCTQARIVRMDEVLRSMTYAGVTKHYHTYPETVLWEGEFFSQEHGKAEDELEKAKLEELPRILKDTGLLLNTD